MPRPANQTANAAPRVFGPGGPLVTRTAEQSAGDPYEFIMSTDDTDRMGDVVEIGGIDLKAFRKNPVALWQHDPQSPIGTWADVRKVGGQLVGKLQLAAEKTSPLIDRLRQLIEQRVLRAVSIGFRALELKPTGDGFGLRFLKTELVECSLVSIPANAAALRVKALAPHPADTEIFSPASAPGSSERTRASQAPPRRRELAPIGAKPMPRTISERIVALQTRSATIDAELTDIQELAAAEDDRDFSADETTSIAALTEEKANVQRNLETLQTLESTLANKAVPAGAGGGGLARLPAQAAVKEPGGSMIGKMALVAALSHVTKQPYDRVIATRYAHDERVAACMDYVTRAATGIADTTTPGWAAELVQQDVGAFMADLVNISVFAALRARASTLDVSLTGIGSLKLPGRTQNGSMAGSWVGETGVIPVVQGTLASAILERTKLAAIATFSKELLDASNGTIETVLRDGLKNDTANALDQKLLDNVARVAGVRPAGLQVGAHTAASGGVDSIRADLKAALAPIIAAGGGQDIVLIMNPAQALGLQFATNMLGLLAFPEMANGQLAGYPFITSLNVPAGVVFVMDAAAFVDTADVPEFTVSEEATLSMASADAVAPTQATADGTIITAGQVPVDGGIHVGGGNTGPATVGVVAMSMFQQWSVAVRMVLPVSWALRRAGMVSTITAVDWGGEP
jgi:HK97 family phage major capsid protein/HK97 family phage prohead protease